MYTPSNIGHTSRALSLQTASSPTPVKGESKASPVSFKADTITNPDELTSFVSTRISRTLIDTFSSYFKVETLLKDLEEKFDNMSMQVLDKSGFLALFGAPFLIRI